MSWKSFFVLPLAVLPCLAQGQTWSKPKPAATLPGIQVQWRVYGMDMKSHKNVFEWLFSNAGDSTASFNYRIQSDRGESRMGRLSLAPGKRQISGWLFAGDSLVDIEVTQAPFRENP